MILHKRKITLNDLKLRTNSLLARKIPVVITKVQFLIMK